MKVQNQLLFSYTLDDWANAWGDMRGIDLNNYAELTALANAHMVPIGQ